MNKVTELNSRAVIGGGLTREEALYLFEVLLEMKEALIYVRKNSIYFKESDLQVRRIADTHAGTVVGIAANIQIKTRRAIQVGGGE